MPPEDGGMWGGRSYVMLEEMWLLVQWFPVESPSQPCSGICLSFSLPVSLNIPTWTWVALNVLESLGGAVVALQSKGGCIEWCMINSLWREGASGCLGLLSLPCVMKKHLKSSEFHIQSLLYLEPYEVSFVRFKIRRWMNTLQISSADIYSQHFLQNNLRIHETSCKISCVLAEMVFSAKGKTCKLM